MSIMTLNELKERLGIDENTWDTLIIRIMQGAQGLIEGYTRRKFDEVKDYDEFYDIDKKDCIICLDHVPVVEVHLVEIDGCAFDGYILYKNTGVVVLKDSPVIGRQKFHIKYSAGFPSAPEDIKEVFALICGEMLNSIGFEGVSSANFADFNVSFNSFLQQRYSTEWSVVREVLDKYRIGCI